MDPLSTCAALDRITRPGGEEAWAILVERHGPAVWRMITSRYADVHLAEDAYQEFWMALPNAARTFTPDPQESERKAQAWIVTVAYRVAIMEHRRRRPTHALTGEPVSAPAPDPDESDERVRQLARLQHALDRLPERYRRPIVLHLVSGMPYEDLAQELRCTVNNARVMVHRGLTRLRQMLGDEDGALAQRTLAGLLPPLLPTPPSAPPWHAPTTARPAILTRSRPRAPARSAPVPAPGPVATLIAGCLLATALAAPSPVPEDVRSESHGTTTARNLATPASQLLDDFARSEPQMLSPERQFAELAIIPAPQRPAGHRALRIAWPAEHHAFVDCVYRHTIAAPAFTADRPASATIQLWTTADAGAAKFSIRFIDAKAEVWQWTTRIPEPQRSGWRTLTIPLPQSASTAHWGLPEALDGVLDFPMRLNGYGVQFTDPNVPAGAVVIADVSLTTP